jgi:hypothetical protein
VSGCEKSNRPEQTHEVLLAQRSAFLDTGEYRGYDGS